jgi:holo-[acyl-carrier protein] synthase
MAKRSKKPAPAAAPSVGLDLVDVPRFSLAVARRGDAFRRRVFTEGEWTYAGTRAERDRVLAARFAAKEAVLKALGTGWGRGISFRDVEVVGGGRAAPTLVLHGAAKRHADALGVSVAISLSHAGSTASAVAIATPTPRA